MWYKKVDRLRAGSILREPKQCMTSLKKGERDFHSQGTTENGSNLPVDLEIIDLEAKEIDKQNDLL